MPGSARSSLALIKGAEARSRIVDRYLFGHQRCQLVLLAPPSRLHLSAAVPSIDFPATSWIRFRLEFPRSDRAPTGPARGTLPAQCSSSRLPIIQSPGPLLRSTLLQISRHLAPLAHSLLLGLTPCQPCPCLAGSSWCLRPCFDIARLHFCVVSAPPPAISSSFRSFPRVFHRERVVTVWPINFFRRRAFFIRVRDSGFDSL